MSDESYPNLRQLKLANGCCSTNPGVPVRWPSTLQKLQLIDFPHDILLLPVLDGSRHRTRSIDILSRFACHLPPALQVLQLQYVALSTKSGIALLRKLCDSESIRELRIDTKDLGDPQEASDSWEAYYSLRDQTRIRVNC